MVRALPTPEQRTIEPQPLGIESKLGELFQIAEELFPGPVSVDIETDPELPLEWYAVFNVVASGDLDHASKRLQWYQRTRQVIPDHCDKVRLSMTLDDPQAEHRSSPRKLMSTIKESAIEVVKGLPDNCTWDDVMYRIYVRQKIESGLRDLEEGRRVPHEEVFKEFQEDASR